MPRSEVELFVAIRRDSSGYCFPWEGEVEIRRVARESAE
jgi:hypothetical protein